MSYVDGLVSVIMPTYHTVQYLERAINSVLNQTYDKLELILINDNTPGDSYSSELYKIVDKYRDNPKFFFLEQERHINGAAARNFGIIKSRGEYIAFLDDDDWWKADKIEKQVAFLSTQNLDCGGVSTLVEYYDKFKPIRWMRPYKDGKIMKEILRREVDVNTGSFLAKRCALVDSGLFDESLSRHQEIQLLSFFTDRYEIKLLPEYLTCYNVSSNNNMPSSEKMRLNKNAFFISISPLLSKLGNCEVHRIKALHYFELAYVEFKEEKYWKSFCDAVYVLRDPITFFLAIKRIIQRKSEYRRPRKRE